MHLQVYSFPPDTTGASVMQAFLLFMSHSLYHVYFLRDAPIWITVVTDQYLSEGSPLQDFHLARDDRRNVC